MTTETPTVRLDLESKPQTLTIVRGMLGGVAESLAIDAELLDDLKTAVSEACNNVVLHAYAGSAGPMAVRLFIDEDAIRVNVEDQGVGMPSTSGERTEGIGLSVIRALADELRISPGSDGGTVIEMDFASERSGRRLFMEPGAAEPDNGWKRETDEEIVVSLSPVTLLPTVLGRLARTLAASAHFSLDRFSDVYLVTDTLAAHAARAAARHRIDARISAAERRLDITVGPFRPGASDSLRDPGLDRGPSPLVLLSDELEIEPEGGEELLNVVVIDHRR